MTVDSGSAVTFTGTDGTALAGRWFEPAERPAGAVVVVPAMATPAAYYRSFASWLCDRGFAVLTFDYRGYGASRNGASMKMVDADLTRWAADARDALAYVAGRAEGAPMTWVGHSLGGQVLPFADHERLARVVTVSAGSGYWRLLPPRLSRWSPLLWRVIAPASIAAFGYYPGGRLGIVGDLPAGVMRQWRRWCLHPEYVVGAEQAHDRFAQVRAPIAALSFSDDEMMSDRSISALHRWYVNSNVTRMRYTPAQLGVSRMGHFGFFREQHAPLWEELLLPHVPARPATG